MADRRTSARGFGDHGPEICSTDLKPTSQEDISMAGAGTTVFVLRDQPVMLAAEVALIFAVETREIVQNIKTNTDIFPEKYAFQLTHSEAEYLRSAGLISKPGRGGSRALPWVVTRKGTIRLATIMRSPRAIEARRCFCRYLRRHNSPDTGWRRSGRNH
jgi:hypothetical protein